MEIRKAIVTNNQDSDKKGKCKLRVLPEMNGVDETKLPWCKPFLLDGGGGENVSSNIPEIGEYVTVFIKDTYWLYIEYLSADYVVNNYPYSDFEVISNNMTELSSQTYPQPLKIQKYADGTIIFHNTSTGEHGFYNKNGSYWLFDSGGNLILNSKSKEVSIKNNSGDLVLTSAGNLELNGNTKTFVTHTELNTAIQSFISILNIHTHIVSTAPGTTAPPLPAMSLDISSAATTTVKTGG